MTHHAQYQPRPARLPRHAAGVTGATPAQSRHPVRAAVRLFVAAGSGAAGLCLIISMITVVVSARAQPRPAARGPADAISDAAPEPGLQGLATYGRATVLFTTRPGSSWQLYWAFRCTGRAGRRYFDIRAEAGGLQLTRRGRTGAGLTGPFHSAGQHRLAVRSGCGWRVQVMQSR